MKFSFKFIMLILLICPFYQALAFSFKNSTEFAKSGSKDAREKWLGSKPVKFLENRGQLCDMNNDLVPYVWFKASAPGVDLYVTEQGLSFVFINMLERGAKSFGQFSSKNNSEEDKKVEWEKVDMVLKGAHLDKRKITKEGEGLTDYNFYFPHCGSGITNVKEYTKITIVDVYPGIDWVLYNSAQSGFKYDFVVHPGADRSLIQMQYLSLKPVVLDGQGNLNIQTRLGQISEKAPLSYYKESKIMVNSAFHISAPLKKGGRFETLVAFKIEESHDPFQSEVDQTLIIDPQLIWATFYGGNSHDGSMAIESDPLGNVFIGGYNISSNLPLVNAGTYFQSSNSPCFLLKFSNMGALLWATYMGSANYTGFSSLTTDNSGNLFVCGTSSGGGMPVLNTGTYFQAAITGPDDAFIVKFSNSGAVLWGTYYGGSGNDGAGSITSDNNGNIFVSGVTTSTNFPLQNAGTFFQGTLAGIGDGYILKFDNLGNRLWATYYEGFNPQASTCDPAGNVIFTGVGFAGMPLMNPGGTSYFQPAITGSVEIGILKFNNTGTRLWATYYGGSQNDFSRSVITDKQGNIFICGSTQSPDFPVLNAGTYFQGALASAAASDMFIIKFNSSGTRLWSTYFGGNSADGLVPTDNMGIDTCGSVYISFDTRSSNLPLQASCDGGFQDNAKDTSLNSAYRDIFIVRFSNTGFLQWATYLGGQGEDFRSAVVTDKYGHTFVTGEWVPFAGLSSSYPITNPGTPAYVDSSSNGNDDIYIVKFSGANGANTFTYTGPVCNGSTFNYAPNLPSAPGSFYNFSASPGLSINPVTGQINASASLPGTYTVTAQSGLCSCSTDTFSSVITLFISPTIVLTGTNTLCVGTSATVTAAGAISYTWNTGTNANPIMFSTNANSLISVSGTGTNGCVSTASVLIKVNSCLGTGINASPSSKIQIFPNPNKGDFTIVSTVDLDLELINEIGQVVRVISTRAANSHRVNVYNLPNGIYFLKDQISGGKLDQKIVVEE